MSIPNIGETHFSQGTVQREVHMNLGHKGSRTTRRGECNAKGSQCVSQSREQLLLILLIQVA